MSWQFIETGMVREVEAKLDGDLAKLKLPEPEHTQLQHALAVIREMLSSYPDWYGVQIKVRGSQLPGWNFKTGEKEGWTNALNLDVEPMPSYGISSGKVKVEEILDGK